MQEILINILMTAILSSGGTVFAGLGELLCELVGVLNLGVEGTMAMGAVISVITVTHIPNPYVGILAALGIGLLLGAVFGFATVICKANQVLCGMALTFMGLGFSAWLGQPYSGQPIQVQFETIQLPVLSNIPVLGNLLFNQTILVYIAYFVLPVTISYLLFSTRHGINVRSVGENPAAADASGVSVTIIRFVYVCVGSGLAAVGGAYITLAFIHSLSRWITGGQGWIAIALVIFAGWRPFSVVLGSLIFGAVTALALVAQAENWGVPSALLLMLPYISTIALMLLPKLRHQPGLAATPSALGIPYYRE